MLKTRDAWAKRTCSRTAPAKFNIFSIQEQNQRKLSKHKKLEEENQALRSEVEELKAQINRLANKIEGGK